MRVRERGCLRVRDERVPLPTQARKSVFALLPIVGKELMGGNTTTRLLSRHKTLRGGWGEGEGL
jgi:hypothetical protein